MASILPTASTPLQLSTTRTSLFSPSHAPNSKPQLTLFTRASSNDNTTESESERKPDKQTKPEPESSDEFESRLSNIRFRYKGPGKKAELRKAKKAGSKKGNAGMYLPPVPLKEAVSSGLKVEFGFSPYSERVNGRIASLGLAALLLVELGTGKSVLNYHTPAIVLIQVYFVAAVGALFVKYEKEKVSVWPQ